MTCKRSDGFTAPDSYCVKYGLSKPIASQSCNTHSCVSYSWTASAWGGCDASCGSGVKRRNVYCTRSTDGANVPTSYCSGTPLVSTMSCYYCGGCSYSETMYLNAKVKHCNAIRQDGRTNWTTSQVFQAMADQGFTVRSHYDAYHVKEKVCGYSSSYCCRQAGLTYISSTAGA